MCPKNIYCQCVLSQEATRQCALPKQGNKARKKTADGNEEVEGPTYSQSEWNPQDDDRIIQEHSCVSGPGSNQLRLEQEETECSRSMSLKQR